MAYVDGYVLPVPKKELAAYKKMASVAAKAWIECGAVEYRECVLDDANVKFGLPFPKGMKLKKSEVAIFAWIMFKSRKHRDKVNAAVMKHQHPKIYGAGQDQKNAVRARAHDVRRLRAPGHGRLRRGVAAGVFSAAVARP